MAGNKEKAEKQISTLSSNQKESKLNHDGNYKTPNRNTDHLLHVGIISAALLVSTLDKSLENFWFHKFEQRRCTSALEDRADN